MFRRQIALCRLPAPFPSPVLRPKSKAPSAPQAHNISRPEPPAFLLRRRFFHIDKDMYKKLTSVDLEPTLNFIKYLQEINKPVWIRYVLVPGYTDDIKDLNDWAKFVSQFDVVKRVDILPFHQMAIYKWEKTNREYKLKDTLTPNKEQIQKAEEIFRKYNLPLYKERS